MINDLKDYDPIQKLISTTDDQFSEAMTAFSKAIELAPHDPVIYNDMGNFLGVCGILCKRDFV